MIKYESYVSSYSDEMREVHVICNENHRIGFYFVDWEGESHNLSDEELQHRIQEIEIEALANFIARV